MGYKILILPIVQSLSFIILDGLFFKEFEEFFPVFKEPDKEKN